VCRTNWHSETNDTFLRTVSYALSVVLHAYVQTFAPTTYFGSPHTPQQTSRMQCCSGAGEDCVGRTREGVVAPRFSRHAIVPALTVPSEGLRVTNQNVLEVTGYLRQYLSPSDRGLS